MLEALEFLAAWLLGGGSMIYRNSRHSGRDWSEFVGDSVVMLKERMSGDEAGEIHRKRREPTRGGNGGRDSADGKEGGGGKGSGAAPALVVNLRSGGKVHGCSFLKVVRLALPESVYGSAWESWR